jgi:PPOX class probable F420-dependent enzyme
VKKFLTGDSSWSSTPIQKFLGHIRVARLGTLNGDGSVHLVPIVFANNFRALYFAIDSKKKKTKNLRRLQNILRTGKATLLVDEYSENWENLRFVMIYTRAQLLGARNRDEIGDALKILRRKYAQYEGGRYLPRKTGDCIVVRLTPRKIIQWSQATSNYRSQSKS